MSPRAVPLSIALCLLALPALASSDRARYVDPVYGFSLEVPALGDEPAAPATVQRLVVSSPMRDGFATNCNVQIQYFDMTHEAFMELSERQFAAMGWTVHRREARKVSGRQATLLEYSGRMAEHDLAFLAVVASEPKRFFVVTCTTLASRLEADRAALQGVIDGFALGAAEK